MELNDVLPAVRQLPTLDKINLIRILAEELGKPANVFPFEPYKVYYLATPYNTYGAGKKLMDALNIADKKPG